MTDHITPKIHKSYTPGPFGQMHLRRAGPSLAASAALGATPLFCFHMSPYSGLIYENWIGEMGRDRTAFAPDTPGFGMSDPPPEQPSIEDYAHAMVRLIWALGTAPVDLMGYHTGSMIAAEVARQAPNAVRKIVMVSAPVFSDDELAELHDTYGPAAVGEDGGYLQKKWDANRYWAMDGVTPERTAELLPEALKNPKISWWGHAAAFAYDFKAAIPSLSHPVLVLNPEDDLVEHTRTAMPLFNTATLHELPGWGHGFLDLYTTEAAAVVREFLDA